MAEPGPRSALAGHLEPGRHGAGGIAPGLRLAEVTVPALAQVLGAPPGDATADAVATALAECGLPGEPPALRCRDGEGVRALWNGPGQYLVASHQHRGAELAELLSGALSGAGAVALDVSHGRTVLRVQGTACREVIAKGCPLDVDAMVPGDCAATVISHFNVLLHCEAEAAFEIYITRSFAVSFLHWLLAAGAEYGVEVG